MPLLPFAPALISAVLYVLAFPPYGFAPLAFVALVPWLVTLLREQHSQPVATRPILTSWVGSMAISLLGFHWVAYVLKQFAGLPWPVAGLGLLGFSTFGQLQWVGFAWLAPRLRPRLGASPLKSLAWLAVGALSYTALDYLLPKLFRDTLGHSWASLPTMRLNARWAGAYGLTFITVFCNLALAWLVALWLDRDEPSAWPVLKRAFPALAAGFLMLLGSFALGVRLDGQIRGRLSDPTARLPLAVIQANIGDIEKISAETGVREARRRVMRAFFELSDQALAQAPRTQAVIWPETAYPSTFRSPDITDDLELDQQVESYARTRKVGVFFGGYDQDRTLRRDYNALFFLPSEGLGLQTYRKNRLLLFGEELPFSDTFPTLRRWFPQVGNFGRGAGPAAIEVPTRPASRAAPAICYEVLFSEDMIRAKRKGAQWILNVTNDSWFGPHAEPELHLALSTFRSIELGIPMIRSTNTGITAWIDALGEVHGATPTFQPAVLPLELPIVELPASLVEILLDPFGKLAVVLSLGAWFGPALRRRFLTAV
jgi:apolipoprotein N-acyltransferase